MQILTGVALLCDWQHELWFIRSSQRPLWAILHLPHHPCGHMAVSCSARGEMALLHENWTEQDSQGVAYCSREIHYNLINREYIFGVIQRKWNNTKSGWACVKHAYDKTQENQMIASAILCFVENAHSVVKLCKKTWLDLAEKKWSVSCSWLCLKCYKHQLCLGK